MPTRARKAEGTKTATEVLLETGVTWKIGDREYVQQPLSIRGLSRVLTTISAETAALVQSPLFASATSIDLTQITTEQLAGIIVGSLAYVPSLLPGVLAAMLGAPDKDIDYIADHATPAQVLKILETFLDQNEPEALVQGFFGLWRRITALVPKSPEPTTSALPEK